MCAGGDINIYRQTLQAINTAVKNKLITGVAISVCKSNFAMALSDEFIEMLHKNGVNIHLVLYLSSCR